MAKTDTIVAFGSDGDGNSRSDAKTEQIQDTVLPGPHSGEENAAANLAEYEEEDRAPSRTSLLPRLAAALAVMAALAWTGFFGWINWTALQQGIAPAGWAPLISDWSAPIMVIGIAWLITMRNSRRQADLFAQTARSLAEESSRLEARLLTVNRELSLAREFISAQSRDLEALGRIATDRLSQNADRLQNLIRDNGARVETIGSVSDAALANMEKLRDQLPVIANSAKDVTNNIGTAGRTAHAQIEEMVAGFKRLNEYGQACNAEVLKLRETTGGTIAEFEGHCERMQETTEARYAALDQKSAEFRDRLDLQQAEALAALRNRSAALAAELEAARKLLESEEEGALASLKIRLTALKEEGSTIGGALLESQREALGEWKSGLAAFDADRSQTFAAMHEAQESLTESAQARLDAIASDAERIQARMARDSRTFAEGLERTRREAQESSGQWLASMTESLEAVSGEIADQGQQIGDYLVRQQDELQARHERIVTELSQRCAALDEELSQKAGALLAQIETHQARLGKGHGELLENLSTRYHAIESETLRRSQEISEQIDARRRQFAADEEQMIAGLRKLLAAMDEEIAARIVNHEQHSIELSRKMGEATAQLEEQSQRLHALASESENERQRMADSLQSLADGMRQAHSLLGGTEKELMELTEASVRLLELIQASAGQSQGELPRALAQSEQRLAALESGIARIGETLEQASSKGQAIAGGIEASDGALKSLILEVETLKEALEAQVSTRMENFANMLRSADEFDSRTEQLANKAQEELSQALDRLAQSARESVSTISETGAASISQLADKLGIEGAEAINRAIRATAAEATGRLEQAAAHASGVSREAAIQLREQLGAVSQLVENLEQRIIQARARAEEQVDNDFSRRVALITEALNSNAIDIAKALSTEVSDTAWAAYLRGDRGIFTRRAVSLLDASETKSIQQIYERDQDFREHVSRFIHDFEAMLRQVLSTRDGNALGVTLLSSDMGKLYVTLAQGIERLRD